ARPRPRPGVLLAPASGPAHRAGPRAGVLPPARGEPLPRGLRGAGVAMVPLSRRRGIRVDAEPVHAGRRPGDGGLARADRPALPIPLPRLRRDGPPQPLATPHLHGLGVATRARASPPPPGPVAAGSGRPLVLVRADRGHPRDLGGAVLTQRRVSRP